MHDEKARQQVVDEVRRKMVEQGLSRSEAIDLMVADPNWLFIINAARTRKAATMGATSVSVARWCAQGGVTTAAVRKVVVGELARRGGTLAVARVMLVDPSWQLLIKGARSKGEGIPHTKTLLRWQRATSNG